MTSNQTNFRKDTRTQFEQIVLVLQGGGALGSYQAGVYQALAEADLQPNWVAGISIGAINSAIIAGNAPDKRVDRLREFWETVSEAPLGIIFQIHRTSKYVCSSPCQSGESREYPPVWRSEFFCSAHATGGAVARGRTGQGQLL